MSAVILTQTLWSEQAKLFPEDSRLVCLSRPPLSGLAVTPTLFELRIQLPRHGCSPGAASLNVNILTYSVFKKSNFFRWEKNNPLRWNRPLCRARYSIAYASKNRVVSMLRRRKNAAANQRGPRSYCRGLINWMWLGEVRRWMFTQLQMPLFNISALI